MGGLGMWAKPGEFSIAGKVCTRCKVRKPTKGSRGGCHGLAFICADCAALTSHAVVEVVKQPPRILPNEPRLPLDTATVNLLLTRWASGRTS